MSISLPESATGSLGNPGPNSRDTLSIPFANTYARLPAHFYARVPPTPVANPQLVQLNSRLAEDLGLDAEALARPEGVAFLSGNQVAAGSEPVALAYAGHQFGHFVPQLGDGRANLLGEVISCDGRRYDLQLKGSGRTPFSRGGDGRAALGPVLREYILSEAMAALGVPTARALAAVTSGETVLRETPLPGAIFTRVASSHLRVGTFQYLAARGDVDGIRILADYAIARHFPDAAQAGHPYRAFLDAVIAGQVQLVAHWVLLGFIHGVMNTDNMSISGDTIDYGPCAFQEAYEPDKVFSSIDHRGRYAYSNQQHAALWNLSRLAETLLPLLAKETGTDEAALASATAALEAFPPAFEKARLAGLRRKLGLVFEHADDAALAEDLLARMAANSTDFTLTFRHLSDAAAGPHADAGVRSLFADPNAYEAWALRWRLRLRDEPATPQARSAAMHAVNPLCIPRNHLVEEAIAAATEHQDFQPFRDLIEATSRPFKNRPGLDRYATPATPGQRVTQTFCGT
jgi:uncharacterized protein YdiU (UPF0061 family)